MGAQPLCLGLVFNQSPAEGWIRLVSGWVYHLAGLACSDCGFYVYTTVLTVTECHQHKIQVTAAAAELLLLLFSQHRATYVQ